MPGVPDPACAQVAASTAGAGAVAIWGAVVATGLALVRLVEFYRDRSPQLRVTCMWRGTAEAGNDLLIMNAGRTPLSIYYFSLVWAKPRWLRSPKLIETEFDLEDDFSSIDVPPFTSYRQHFNGGDHFSATAPERLNGCTLYLRAWVVGRSRPVWRKVFD